MTITERPAVGVHLLGDFTVTVGEASMNPSPGISAAILAFFALNAGRPIPAVKLINELWAPEPPANAAARLHVHISRLRRLLDELGAPDSLTTRGSAYSLQVDLEACDHHRFESFVSNGSAALQSERHEAAQSAFRDALALWRGPPLAAWVDQQWARAEATRLSELHVTAVEGLAEALLALGCPEEATALLQGLVVEDPLRESAVGMLMLALYQSGRQADALEVFAHTRNELADALGIDPSPPLQNTYLSIVRQDETALPRMRTSSYRQQRASGSEQVVEVPARNPAFRGREQLLDQLNEALRTERSDGPATVVLVGMGGAGKTRVALEYAHRVTAHEAIVWWVPAAEPVGLAESLTRLATRLDIGHAMDQASTISELWKTLSHRNDWTIVFDNCPDPETLRSFAPVGGHGRVLVTSRHRAWRGAGVILAVDVLGHKAATDLLLETSGDDDIAAAADLATQLGGLPLALTQAAAYVDQTGMSLARYVGMFRSRRLALLSRALPEDYQGGVVTTWDMSFDQIRARSPKAAQLLELCAGLGDADIPLELLAEGAPAFDDAFGDLLADDLAMEDAIAELLRFSLVGRDEQVLRMHPLVRAVLLGRMSATSLDEDRDRVRRLLVRAEPKRPDDPAGWSRWSRWVPHAVAAAERHEMAGEHAAAVPFLLAAGEYLNARALFEPAQRVLESGVRCAVAAGGESGHDLVVLLSELGVVREHLGNLDAAGALQRQALDLLLESDNADGPEAARVLQRLGGVLSCQRDLGPATSALDRAIQIQTLQGPSHGLGTCLADLAFVQWTAGDLAKARANFARSISVLTETVGSFHPDVAHARSGLAVVLQDMGRLDEALELQLAVIDSMTASMGESHPFTAHAHDKAGYLLRLLGRSDASREAHERALEILKMVYGPDHVELGMPLTNLGLVQLEAGQFAEAERSQRRAQVLFSTAFGPHHPHTALAARRLGAALMAQGTFDAAETLLSGALDDTIAAFGSDHPDVAATREELIRCRMGRSAS